MNPIQIELSGQETLEQAQKMLGDHEKFRKALNSTTKRVGSYIRTNSSKFIRERYALPAAVIKASETVNIYFSEHGGGCQVNIDFAGRKIPLYRYTGASPAMPTQDPSRTVRAIVGGSWKMVHPSVEAYGHQLKGTPAKVFHNAFVARTKSGHIGIFERTGGATQKGSDETQEIMGSAVPQMLGSKTVYEKLAREAAGKFDGWLEHEINAFLNGYR